jgi:hypothetical protein
MNIKKADCVIALSFGKSSIDSKHDPNRAIATIAMATGLPIITQPDVAMYCSSPVSISSKAKGYQDTWDVLSGAQQIMARNTYKCAILIAHKAHVSRARNQASKLGISHMVSALLPEVWDRQSQQWWTRSPWLWYLHEYLYAIPKLTLLKRF